MHQNSRFHKDRKLRIVLTGASRGIGAAIAHALVPHAEWICLVGRDAEALRRVQDAMAGISVTLVTGDISDPVVQQHIASAVGQAPLDVLINNAGISHFGAVEHTPSQMIGQLLSVNLVAPIQLTQILLPALKKCQTAQVINIGSTFSYIGYPGFAVYCASKFGLRGFTEAMDRELGDSWPRVRLFSPRATSTEINAPEVKELNHDLGVSQDSPEAVAQQFVHFLFGSKREHRVGGPERIFTMINQLLPRVVDRALYRQLARVKRAFPALRT